MPVPVHVEQSEVRPLDSVELGGIAALRAQGDGPASLLVEAENGQCAFAQAQQKGETITLSLLDAALASWLQASGRALHIRRDPAEPCEGLPPIEQLSVPGQGWAIGLSVPADSVDAAGDLSVQPVGADGRWWFVTGQGAAALAFSHPSAPPTRFMLRFEPARPAVGSRQVIPRSGALALDLRREGGTGLSVVLADPSIARAQVEGDWLVLVGLAPGPVDGVFRVGDQPPEPLHLEVGAPLGPSRQEISLPAGKTRTLKLDMVPESVFIADEKLAALELREQKVVLRGIAPGRTHLVIRQGSELFLVPLAIGH